MGTTTSTGSTFPTLISREKVLSLSQKERKYTVSAMQKDKRIRALKKLEGHLCGRKMNSSQANEIAAMAIAAIKNKKSVTLPMLPVSLQSRQSVSAQRRQVSAGVGINGPMKSARAVNLMSCRTSAAPPTPTLTSKNKKGKAPVTQHSQMAAAKCMSATSGEMADGDFKCKWCGIYGSPKEILGFSCVHATGCPRYQTTPANTHQLCHGKTKLGTPCKRRQAEMFCPQHASVLEIKDTQINWHRLTLESSINKKGTETILLYIYKYLFTTFPLSHEIIAFVTTMHIAL